jgi:tetratricopeptide (TPR) repeat protein
MSDVELSVSLSQSQQGSSSFLAAGPVLPPGDESLEDTQRELLRASADARSRGLTLAARWAADLALACHAARGGDLSTSTAGGASPPTTRIKNPRGGAAAAAATRPHPAVALARQHLRAKRFLACAEMLRNPVSHGSSEGDYPLYVTGGPLALFLYCFAQFCAGEQARIAHAMEPTAPAPPGPHSSSGSGSGSRAAAMGAGPPAGLAVNAVSVACGSETDACVHVCGVYASVIFASGEAGEARVAGEAPLMDGFNWWLYGVTLSKVGQPAEAQRALRKSVALEPLFWSAWLDLANVALRLAPRDPPGPAARDEEEEEEIEEEEKDGKEKEKEKEGEKQDGEGEGEGEEDDDYRAHWVYALYRAHVLLRMDDAPRAGGIAASLDAELSGKSSFVKAFLARCAFQEGRDHVAIEFFKSAQNLDPHRVEDCDVFAEVLFDCSLTDDLGALCARVHATSGQAWRCEASVALSFFFASLGERQRAAASAKRALRGDPNCAPAWLALGAALDAIDDPIGAAAALRSAVEIDPSSFRCWYTLGRCVARCGGGSSVSLSEAAVCMKRAAGLRPRSPAAWAALGDILLARFMLSSKSSPQSSQTSQMPQSHQADSSRGRSSGSSSGGGGGETAALVNVRRAYERASSLSGGRGDPRVLRQIAYVVQALYERLSASSSSSSSPSSEEEDQAREDAARAFVEALLADEQDPAFADAADEFLGKEEALLSGELADAMLEAASFCRSQASMVSEAGRTGDSLLSP